MSIDDVPVEIECREVARLREEGGNMLLLDCREPHEDAIVRIEGATLIPMREIPQRIEELRPWVDQPIVVYCHHGMRSLQVTHWLRQQGFQEARNMTGGIDAWACEIDPGLPRY